MRKIVLILMLLLILLVPACSADDPMYVTFSTPENLFTKNVYPSADNTYDLGSEDLQWRGGHFDSIDLGGAPLLIPAYGEIYFTEYAIIECTEADVFYLVSGNSTTGEILGFENNGLGRLTYTDITPNRVCLINTAITAAIDEADVPAIVQLEIYKNGIADPASLAGDYFLTADIEAIPMTCLIEILTIGDYLEIYVSSSSANTTVTFYTMTLIAATVD